MNRYGIIIIAFLTLSVSAFAQSKVTCSQEVLRCELSKILNGNFDKKKIDSLVGRFEYSDGNECGVTLIAEDQKSSAEILIIELGDISRKADIYTRTFPRGEVGSTSVLFPVEQNKPFYFRSGDLHLECRLSNK